MIGLIGLDQQLKKLRDFLVNYSRVKAKVAILYGACGVGKTSSVYIVANELGYKVIEFNASDNRTYEFFDDYVRRACCCHSFTPTVVLLDEFECVSMKAQQIFAKMMSRFVKPVIITTNDISSIIASIRKHAIEIYYPKPSVEHVVKFAKELGCSDLSRVKGIGDFRQLGIAVKHGSDVEIYNEFKTQKERILDSLNTGKYDCIEKSDIPIILDTVSSNLGGVDLWRFVEALRVYDITGKSDVLNGLKLSVRDVVNSFYAKIADGKREV